MKNARSMLGMPVICDGRKLGRASSVLTADALNAVSGLFLHCGLAGSRFIGSGELDLIGDIAILAHSPGRRLQPARPPLLRRAVSPGGERIGAITDVLLAEGTLRIEALELSRGYLDDLACGRASVRQFTVQKNGDVVVELTEGGNPV